MRCNGCHPYANYIGQLAGWSSLQKGKPVWFYQDYPGMFEDRPEEAWLLRHALAWHRGAIADSHYSVQELMSFSAGDVRYIGAAISHYEVFRGRQGRSKQPHAVKQIMYLGDFRPRKAWRIFSGQLRSSTAHFQTSNYC